MTCERHLVTESASLTWWLSAAVDPTGERIAISGTVKCLACGALYEFDTTEVPGQCEMTSTESPETRLPPAAIMRRVAFVQ